MGRVGPTVAGEVAHRLGSYELTVANGFGPRILGLKRDDSPEILVRLAPEVAIDAGRAGTYRFRGGHRLWASPEIPDVTYAPDDEPCRVVFDGATLRVSGPVDSAGFRKNFDLRDEGGRMLVDHRLAWEGSVPITAGAWSITQLPVGGTALLPLRGRDDASPRQADRALVLWPYSHLSDPRLSFCPEAVLLQAGAGPQLKIGSGPHPGRLGYLREGWLFTKDVEPAGPGTYPDRGAVGQVYINEHFCELESLGPLAELQPGAEVRLREIWQVSRCADVEEAVARVLAA